MTKCILKLTAGDDFDETATLAYRFYLNHIKTGLTGSEPPKTLRNKNEVRIVLYKDINSEMMSKITNELKCNAIKSVSFNIEQDEIDTFEW